MSDVTLLIVDDSHEMRDFLSKVVFGLDDYKVETARDGLEALELIHSVNPGIVITDIAMPGMTGLEMVEAMRRDGIDTPVIVMTAEGSETQAIKAMRAGVLDYFVKPFDPVEMERTVERILSNRSKASSTPGSSRDFNSRAFMALHTPVFALDAGHTVVGCNRAALSLFELTGTDNNPIGHHLGELTGNRALLDMLISKDSSPVLADDIELEDGRIMKLEISIMTSGERLVTLHDISPVKAVERRRAEAISAISHDMRSPLTAILGYIELMSRTGNLSETQLKFTAQVAGSVQTLTTLVNDLIEADRMGTSETETIENIDLADMVGDVIMVLRTHASLRDIDLIFEAPRPVPEVKGNRRRLRQAFFNLIENAIKYTNKDGSVKVALSVQDGQPIAAISDTGIGIPIEDQPHIFERYFRSANAMNIDGTGRGLSIVKDIIEEHGGRIWVESYVDIGSTFFILLPAAEASSSKKQSK